MPRKIKFTKQYKPIKFGDRPDPGTVEGHRNAMAEAADTRAYNRMMKELAAEDAAKTRGLLRRCLDSSSRSQEGRPLIVRRQRHMQKIQH
jgi:hypothetical protein